jgi:hypothetical protein
VEQLVVSLLVRKCLHNNFDNADDTYSNGDKGWTAGPPQDDAVFKIQKIVMYYNPGA